MPRRKKDPSVRARRNKASTSATLHRVGADTTSSEVYAAMTVVQLRAEIDRRNDDGRTNMLSRKGTKSALVQALVSDDSPVPALPEHPSGWWHKETVGWWSEAWSSPMAREWDPSDFYNVYLAALVLNDAMCGETAKARKDAAAEFRLQRVDLGLSPYSRRRLEWTIEAAGEAQDKGQQRRTRRAATAAGLASGSPGAPTGAGPGQQGPATVDPRRVLEAVK